MPVFSPTLAYPPIQNGITNILLIDDSVRDYQVFIDSVNAQTLPIVYSPSCSKQELLNVLTANFQTLSRVAFVFETNDSYTFLDNAPMFVLNEQSVPCGENVDFLIALIRQFQIQNIDFLACNTLNMPEWKAFYDVLGKETNVVVGASSDNTGNIHYGGDWIMESTGQDVEVLYFSRNIDYYQYLLGSIYSYSSFVIATNGTIYCCGWNTKNQLGLGSGTTDTSRNYWSTMDQTNISGLLATYISTGGENPNEYHTLVVMTNGALYGCGTGTQGTLTNISFVNKLTLLNNTTGSTFTSVSASPFMSYGITANGSLWGWGYNSKGELANGTTNQSSTMVQYSLPSGTTAIQVCGGSSIMYVLLSNGTVYGAGSFNNGKAGAQGINTSAINNVTSLTHIVIPNNDVATKIACGYNNTDQGHLLILCANGKIYGTGANVWGQLGISNNNNPIGNLTQMVNSTGLTPVDIETAGVMSYVLMNNNALYACGDNQFGQYGIGTQTPSFSLTLSTNSTGKVISRIAANFSHAHMLMTDGTLYGTGYNAFGQLGLNNNTNPITTWTLSSPPTLIQTVADYSSPYSIYSIPCFLEGSKILTNKGYKMVKELRRGDLIQTLYNGFLPIDCIGYSTIYNSGNTERISKRLYRCSTDAYDKLFEDLIVTGCHSILVDEFKEGEREKTFELLEDIYVTDGKLRLPACVDERAIPYEKEGTFTIWHFALENENYYENYGVYANGLLVESTSKRYMRELSNMILIE